MRNELRCQQGGEEFVDSGFRLSAQGVHQSTRSSFPISRSSCSSNYTPIISSVSAGLAFLFFIRLGFAAEHRAHTHLLPLFDRKLAQVIHSTLLYDVDRQGAKHKFISVQKMTCRKQNGKKVGKSRYQVSSGSGRS